MQSAATAFADVLTVQFQENVEPIVADRLTLLVVEADGLPVGQAWLEKDQRWSGSPEIAERVRRRRAEPPAPAFQGKVSVVICTRDRADELRRCLASFSLQSRAPDEVIVVDNASVGDTTREVVLAAGATYVREDQPGLDYARNSGAKAASGEIVLYTDDDTELHPLWIEKTLAAFDSEKILAVTGLVLPATLKTEAQWLFETDWGFGRGFERIDYDPAFYRATRDQGCPAWVVGAGANMAFRRSVFEQVGLFDERLDVGRAGCSGDSEFWYRILAAGGTCRYEPTAVVRHHHRLTMDGLSSQIFHYMRGHTASLMVQHERTGDRGNLRRAFITLPTYYAGSVLKRMARRGEARPQFLRQQVAGALSGLLYYMRSSRSATRAMSD
jgi:GT2 family glycosyltransferase